MGDKLLYLHIHFRNYVCHDVVKMGLEEMFTSFRSDNHDEGYSRNASCSLNVISTCLLRLNDGGFTIVTTRPFS